MTTKRPARKRKPTTRRATPPALRTPILCPTCNQDMTKAPHEGSIDCPHCGQAIRSKTTVRLARLIAKWLSLADSLESSAFNGSAHYTRQCASQLLHALHSSHTICPIPQQSPERHIAKTGGRSKGLGRGRARAGGAERKLLLRRAAGDGVAGSVRDKPGER